MIRYHIIFKGRVQGVGFRYQVKILADELKITGTIKNLYDLSVEAYVQGRKSQLDEFFKGLENINFARIENKNIEEVGLVTEENDFQIIY
ncbi:acylphosphatase [uncultured Anaerococcus sp.]|uniref:acylphosphatase n=1 Tax=uncultured Anaerococcus sp. TaxID=293428 RepID=UPI0025EC861D|nr:acylphosphatase [uncultured Anaerococcus sp.]